MEDNGCEGLDGEYKPYSVKYQLTTKGEDHICMRDGENTLDCLMEALAVSELEPCDFDVLILEKKEIKHMDEWKK